MEITKECAQCKVVFKHALNPNFPDKRKYCDECSAERKASWNAKQGQQQIPMSTPTMQETTSSGSVNSQESRHDVIVSRTEKPHSYEFGRASARHKLYYSDVPQLLLMIAELKEAGLVEEVPSVLPTDGF